MPSYHFRYEGEPSLQTSTIGNPENVGIVNFTPSVQEVQTYRDQLKILVARELSSYFPSFSWMHMVFPNHIPHEFADLMSQKSTPYVMPLLLKNEAKYDDCIEIMDSYVAQIQQWYIKAGRGKHSLAKYHSFFT